MFHLTLMPNIQHLFEGFSILKKTDTVENIYSYPKDYNFKSFYQFIFPCDCPKDKTEEYTIVISDGYNSRSFLICRYLEVHKIYLCIYSYNPWFEILSKILLTLCNNEFVENHRNIDKYFQQIYQLDSNEYVTLPPSSQNDKTSQQILKCSLKYPYIYDKYIQEYLTAIKQTSDYNKKLWIEVFWSMLLERPVIFMSKRYQKLTSSLIAAIFFLHPLSWVHKIVSIIPKKSPELLGMNCCMLGIHSCMEPALAKAEYWNEALLVDLDVGESRMVGACENEEETKRRFKIPKNIKMFFAKCLPDVDESVSQHTPMRIKNIISNMPWDINITEETLYNEYKKGFHIYSLLFRTVIAMLIGHYRECISEKHGSYEFDKKKFISYDPKLTEFLKLLVNSQCFNSFIDEKLTIIQQNRDFCDRFDRERMELNSTEKSKGKLIKFEKLQKKLFTVINAKSEENLSRKGKISTMPNLKKNRIRKISNPTNFQSNDGGKTVSLSSSTSSINSINIPITKKVSSDCLSIQSESLATEFSQEMKKNSMMSQSCPNRDSQLSSATLIDHNETSRRRTSTQNSIINEKLKQIPERPTNPPIFNKYFPEKSGDSLLPKKSNVPKDVKIQAGKVRSMIDNINKINSPVGQQNNISQDCPRQSKPEDANS